MDSTTLTGILISVVGVLLAIIGFLLKAAFEKYDERISRTEKDNQDIKYNYINRFHTLETKVEQGFNDIRIQLVKYFDGDK